MTKQRKPEERNMRMTVIRALDVLCANNVSATTIANYRETRLDLAGDIIIVSPVGRNGKGRFDLQYFDTAAPKNPIILPVRMKLNHIYDEFLVPVGEAEKTVRIYRSQEEYRKSFNPTKPSFFRFKGHEGNRLAYNN